MTTTAWAHGDAAAGGRDGARATALSGKSTAADKLKTYKEFKKAWDASKKTRDKIVPALRGGKKDAASALAKGIQAGRFQEAQRAARQLGRPASKVARLTLHLA